LADTFLKKSYTIPCSTSFRDAISALAEKRGANVADLARSIVLSLPNDIILEFPDPGGPLAGDRERIILKSGKSKGRPWQRKPRLQVRLVPGYDIPFLRRALNMALAIDQRKAQILVDAPELGINAGIDRFQRVAERARQDCEKLESIIDILTLAPLQTDVETRADALYVLGYHAMARPTAKELRTRFRQLSTVHHPDSGHGSHERMSQLNAAASYLKLNRD